MNRKIHTYKKRPKFTEGQKFLIMLSLFIIVMVVITTYPEWGL